MNFIAELDRVVKSWSLLNHPFYQSWTDGALSRDALRQYACQYYQFVKHFPRFLSATHMNTPDLRVRQTLLMNLMDEESGVENHPELWRRFALSTGASQGELESTHPLPQTDRLVMGFIEICRDRSFTEGLGALYAYESQVPEVSRVKVEGLKKFYGIDDPEAVRFFTVHMEADVEHSRAERELIEEHARTDDERRTVLRAAEETAERLWRFLDGVYNTYVTAVA